MLLSTFQSTGLSIGLGLRNTSDITESVILAFAGGTFIYIACGEILSHEFDRNQPMWLKYVKFLMYIFGAAIITVMWLLDLDDIPPSTGNGLQLGSPLL
jgi:zinc transporter ZupT